MLTLPSRHRLGGQLGLAVIPTEVRASGGSGHPGRRVPVLPRHAVCRPRCGPLQPRWPGRLAVPVGAAQPSATQVRPLQRPPKLASWPIRCQRLGEGDRISDPTSESGVISPFFGTPARTRTGARGLGIRPERCPSVSCPPRASRKVPSGRQILPATSRLVPLHATPFHPVRSTILPRCRACSPGR
jgi:hypothetical protein